MLIIVDDKRECVSFCYMSLNQFMQLSIIVSFARANSCQKIRKAASELSLNRLWKIDLDKGKISLLRMPWDQVFMLRAVLLLFSKRNIGHESRKVVNFLMDTVHAAVKSSLKMDCVSYGKRAKDIHLR